MTDSNLLLFDADDTLWERGLFFRRAAEDFVRLLVGLGFDAQEMTALVHRRDIERLSVTGYGAEPYIDTLQHVLAEVSPSPPDFARAALDDIARALLDHPMLPHEGVIETLDTLAAQGRTMVVWTLGQPGHQGDKLARCGFSDRFERAFIVPAKSAATLQGALDEFGVPAARTTVIGNSPRSDINPALAVGARAIWIPDDNPWVAEHQPFERPEDVTRLERFADLLGVV